MSDIPKIAVFLTGAFSDHESRLIDACIRLSEIRKPTLRRVHDADAHESDVVIIDCQDDASLDINITNAPWLQDKTIITVDETDSIHTSSFTADLKLERPVQWTNLPSFVEKAIKRGTANQPSQHLEEDTAPQPENIPVEPVENVQTDVPTEQHTTGQAEADTELDNIQQEAPQETAPVDDALDVPENSSSHVDITLPATIADEPLNHSVSAEDSDTDRPVVRRVTIGSNIGNGKNHQKATELQVAASVSADSVANADSSDVPNEAATADQLKPADVQDDVSASDNVNAETHSDTDAVNTDSSLDAFDVASDGNLSTQLPAHEAASDDRLPNESLTDYYQRQSEQTASMLTTSASDLPESDTKVARDIEVADASVSSTQTEQPEQAPSDVSNTAHIDETEVDEEETTAQPTEQVAQDVSKDVAEAESDCPVSEKTNHLLIVDDSDSIRRHMSMLLEQKGITVSTAASAEEALEIVKTERFDGILMDVVMTGASGYDACREIKASFSKDEAPPIIMLTSKSTPFDQIKGKMAGCDAYLTKPTTMPLLKQTLTEHTQIRMTTN